jgi:group I intron endonuclease
MISGIYKIVSPKGRIYIGSSINVSRRISDYKKGVAGKRQPRLYSSFLKYGTSNHTFEQIEQCEILFLKDRERYWQDFYNVVGAEGLNCVLVEAVGIPKQHTELTKQKIARTLTGRLAPHSTETRNNISKSHRKRWESEDMLRSTGRSVTSMQELQEALGITFPTLKRRLDEYNLSKELIGYWKKGRAEYIMDLVEKYHIYATNTEHLVKLLAQEFKVSAQTLRKVIKQFGHQERVYFRMNINKLEKQ